MSIISTMEILSSGLAASRLRMNLIASNLANANTTRGVDGGPYKRKDAVFQATPVELPFEDVLNDEFSNSLQGVVVTDVVSDPRPPRTVFHPGHPDADKDGIVKLPNVHIIEEMVDMIMASRNYEAGVNTLQSVKQMADRSLQIGR